MIDRYTKSVLTVVAACLVWLCVKNFTAVRPAVASTPQPVTIVGIGLPDWCYINPRNCVLPVWQTK